MAKLRPTEISVTTVFDGKKDGREVFIELILLKHRNRFEKFKIDAASPYVYNQGRVFSDVRVGKENVV